MSLIGNDEEREKNVKKYVKQVRAKQRRYSWQWKAHAFAHNALHIIIFAGAVTIPFLIQLKIPDFITIIISALVAIAAAISQFFQFAERRRIYRQTYEDLKNELTCYEVHGGIYRDLTPEDAFQHFLKQTLKLMNQNVEAFFIVVGKEPTLDLKQHRQEDETM